MYTNHRDEFDDIHHSVEVDVHLANPLSQLFVGGKYIQTTVTDIQTQCKTETYFSTNTDEREIRVKSNLRPMANSRGSIVPPPSRSSIPNTRLKQTLLTNTKMNFIKKNCLRDQTGKYPILTAAHCFDCKLPPHEPASTVSKTKPQKTKSLNIDKHQRQ